MVTSSEKSNESSLDFFTFERFHCFNNDFTLTILSGSEINLRLLALLQKKQNG
jgi:hypothetical protein